VELVRYAAYGKFNGVALSVVLAVAVVSFLAAALAYDPQRGLIRRRAAGVVA
jgi:ABC-2 type transport system permease protein